jgi:phosphoglycolate phosphatase
MRLILYDIDGTLTRSQNGFAPFNEAIFATFGFAGDIRTVVPDGNTDPRIVADIFANANRRVEIHESQWRVFSENLCARYASAIEEGKTVIHALPGAAALLRQLCDDDAFSQSVVTGNLESVAAVKLQCSGLQSFLLRGAYGSDSAHRPDLPGIAKERWQQASGRTIASQDCIIVGDTPKDLDAARQNHMKCVLVSTGRYPVEELRCFQPDAVVADLTDTDAMIKMFLQV